MKTAADYPIIIVDENIYHVCPTEDGRYVLLSPDQFESKWWRSNPWIDTHVDQEAPTPVLDHTEAGTIIIPASGDPILL